MLINHNHSWADLIHHNPYGMDPVMVHNFWNNSLLGNYRISMKLSWQKLPSDGKKLLVAILIWAQMAKYHKVCSFCFFFKQRLPWCLKDVRTDLMANLIWESGLSPKCFPPADFGTLQDFRDSCHRDFSISDSRFESRLRPLFIWHCQTIKHFNVQLQ